MPIHHRKNLTELARIALFSALLAASLLVTSTAGAHQLFFDYGTHTRAGDALEVPDITISRILYADFGCPIAPVWLTFEADEGQLLFVELGMPAFESLARERPALALVGPGLPAAGRLPWPAPPGLGARIFLSTGTRRPRLQRDPQTGALSWILLSGKTMIPRKGKYYLVAFNPSGHRTHLWVSTGTEDIPGSSNVDDPEERLKLFYDPQLAPELGAPCPSRAAASIPALGSTAPTRESPRRPRSPL